MHRGAPSAYHTAMFEFNAMLTRIAAAIDEFASAAVGLAMGVGIWIATVVVLSVSLVGVAARERGRNGFAWALFAIVLLPPVAALLLLVMPNRAPDSERIHAERNQRGLTLCPHCAEVVRREAIRCRHCGAGLGGGGDGGRLPLPAAPEHAKGFADPPTLSHGKGSRRSGRRRQTGPRLEFIHD